MNSVGANSSRAFSLGGKKLLPIPSIGHLLSNRRFVSSMIFLLACLFAIAAGRELARRPVFIVGGMLGAILLGSLAVRPRMTVIFVMAYTPFEEFLLKLVAPQAYALARYLPEVLLLSTLAMLLVSRAARRQPIGRTPIDIPLFCFLGVSLLSIFYNRISLLVGVLELRILLRYAVGYYVLVLAGFDKQFLNKVFRLMLGIVALQVGLGLLHSILGNTATAFLAPQNVTIGDLFVRRGFSQVVSSHTRIFSTFGRYNLYANFLSFFLLFFVAILYSKRGEFSGVEKRKIRVLLIAGLVVLTLSFSRMSWMGFYAGFISMLLLMRKNKVISYMVIPMVGTFVLFQLFGAGSREVSETAAAGVLQRYLGMFSRRYVEVSLRSDRLYAITTTTRRVMQISPALGLGPGSVASAAGKVFGGGERWDVLDLPAEKVMPLGDVGWAAILVQYGILGLSAFLWIISRIFTASLACFHRARDSLEWILGLGFVGGFVCIMVENMFSFNFTYRASSLYFWMFAGIVVRLLQIQKDEERVAQR